MDSVELQQLRQSNSRQEPNASISSVAQVGRFSRNRRKLSMKPILIAILLISCVIVSIGFTVTYAIRKTSAVDEYKAMVRNNNEEYGYKAPVFRKPNVDYSYSYNLTTVRKPSTEDSYKSTTRKPNTEDTYKSTTRTPNAEDVQKVNVQPRNKFITSQLRFMKQIMPGLDVSIDPCTDFYQFACGKYNWTDGNALVTSHQFNGTLEILKILVAPSTFTDIAALNYAKSYFRSCVIAKLLAGNDLQFQRLYLTKYISRITENVLHIEQRFGLLHRNGINTLLKVGLKPVNQTLIAIEISVNKMFGKMVEEIIHEDYEFKISDIFVLQFAAEFVEALKEIKSNDANVMEDESLTSTGTEQGDVVGNNKVQVMSAGELINKLSKTTGNTNGTLVNKFNWKLFLLSMLPAGTFLNDYVFLVRHEQLLKAIVKVFAKKQVDEAFLLLQEFAVKIYLMEDEEESDDDRDQFYFSEMKWKAFATNSEASSFISNQVTCARETNSFFGMAIGLKYMENNRQFFKVTMEASTLAKNLRLQFLKDIESIPWLNPEARSKLMEKVVNLSFTFGDVKRKREEVVRYCNHFDFGTQTATYFQKKVQIQASLFQTLVKELPKLKSVEFILSPIVSGAVYIKFVNNIYVSANMINLFLGKNEFRSMNYGGMGFILGHEIIHSVDSDSIGNRYSNAYNLSSEGVQTYEEKVNCFLNRFNSSKNNGNATLAENIADAGGLSLSLKAYDTFINESGPENDQYNFPYAAAQIFFMGFAQFHCSPIPFHGDGIHSYPKLRVLGTLQNTKEFYEAYNCPVPANHNFCKIW